MNNETDNSSSDRIEQALRLADLRHKLTELNGGPLIEGGTENLPMDLQEAFWKNVLHFETTEEVSFAQILKERIQFSPEPITDQDSRSRIKKKLWKLIHALADIGVFLHNTDHLSNEELYDCLTNQLLQETTTPTPEDSGWNTIVDITEFGTADEPDGFRTRFRYYGELEYWDDEDGNPPTREKPAYNRDRFLPGSQKI